MRLSKWNAAGAIVMAKDLDRNYFIVEDGFYRYRILPDNVSSKKFGRPMTEPIRFIRIFGTKDNHYGN